MNWYAVAIIQLLVAIVVPLWLHERLDFAQQWIVGLVLFTVFILLDLLWVTRELYDWLLREKKIEKTRQEIEGYLQEIEGDWVRLATPSENRPELFLRILKKRIERLRNSVHNAADKKELFTDENHMQDSAHVLRVFDDQDTNEFWDVYTLCSDERIFNHHTGDYFKNIYELVLAKKIRNVRSLFILDDQEEDALRRVKALVKFYEQTPGFDCRVLTAADYNTLFQDARLEQCADFGIYGARLLFRTMSYEPVCGIFSYDIATISSFRDFFEGCWQSHRCMSITTDTSDVTIKAILAL